MALPARFTLHVASDLPPPPRLTPAFSPRLVERFLMDGYQPQQLSTFALTLFRYNFKHPVDGKEFAIGALSGPARPRAPSQRRSAQSSLAQLCFRRPGGPSSQRGTQGGEALLHLSITAAHPPRVFSHRLLGHRGTGALREPPPVLLLPRPQRDSGLRRHPQGARQPPPLFLGSTSHVRPARGEGQRPPPSDCVSPETLR